MTRFNTSRAVQQPVDIFNLDQLPLSLTFKDPTDNTPIDLTPWRFEFILQYAGNTVATYSLAKNVMSNTHLQKTGDDNNVLNMQAMFEDIRDNKITVKGNYNLLQVVTDADEFTYVQVIYEINARNY